MSWKAGRPPWEGELEPTHVGARSAGGSAATAPPTASGAARAPPAVATGADEDITVGHSDELGRYAGGPGVRRNDNIIRTATRRRRPVVNSNTRLPFAAARRRRASGSTFLPTCGSWSRLRCLEAAPCASDEVAARRQRGWQSPC